MSVQAPTPETETVEELEDRLAAEKTTAGILQLQHRLQKMTGAEYVKCFRCGCISTLGQRYFKSSVAGPVCPRCSGRPGFSWIELAALGVIALLVVQLQVLLRDVPSMRFVGIALALNFGLLLILTFALIIPHELAHAALGLALGGRVYEIGLGGGPLVGQWRLGEWFLTLSRYPTCGFCAVYFPGRQGLRLRMLIVTSAGLLVNLALLAVFLPGFEWN